MGSLYIHIPFCVRKCHYCGFYSTNYSPQLSEYYIQALAKEAYSSRDGYSRDIDTVYVGGGTPSVLAPDQVMNIIEMLRRNFRIQSGGEFSIEANPNSLTPVHLAMLREQGVNRISLGVQSFSDALLGTLGRLHTAEQARNAFHSIREHGFNNVSIDLIYGIPGQSQSEWADTLHHGIGLNPEHISVYCLSLDEGSLFKKECEAGKLSLPDEDVAADQYELAVNTLKRAGYEHYEISNFSRPGFACRHNLNYWKRGEYLGLGPGAWSFISGSRYKNIADVQEYNKRLEAGIPVIESEDRPTPEQAAHELVLLALRTSAGLNIRGFEDAFGSTNWKLMSLAEPLKQSGLLEEVEGRLRLTTRGFFLSNEVLTRLFL